VPAQNALASSLFLVLRLVVLVRQRWKTTAIFPDLTTELTAKKNSMWCIDESSRKKSHDQEWSCNGVISLFRSCEQVGDEFPLPGECMVKQRKMVLYGVLVGIG